MTKSPAAWKWAFKSLIITLSAFLLFLEPRDIKRLLFFIGTALGVYFLGLEDRKSVKKSFFLTAILVIIGSFWLIESAIEAKVITSLLLGLIFLLILGLGNLLFTEQETVYQLTNTFLGILGAAIILNHNPFNNFWTLPLYIFLLFFILTSELLEKVGKNKKKQIVESISIGLVMAEIVSLSQFLPFNLLSMTAFVNIFYIILKNILKSSISGHFGLKFGLYQALIITIPLLIIFGTAGWNL